MNSIKTSNQMAVSICSHGYRYLYGAKGQKYTKALVERLAKDYPNVFTAKVKAEALKDAGKNYRAIDCSGFVCKVLGIGNIGSAQIYQTAVRRYPVKKADARPGMVLWRSGHVAYVGEDLKIYEARSTKMDLKVSSWNSRAKAFTNLLVVKGSCLASKRKKPDKKENPYKEPKVNITSAAVAKKNKLKTYQSKGEGVKWVQWELCEAGYKKQIDKAGGIDGICGNATVRCIRAFQASCKITVDGIAGAATRKYLCR